MGIVTGKGDRGETALADGRRLCKDHLAFQALGDLDELSAQLGVACVAWHDAPTLTAVMAIQRDIIGISATERHIQDIEAALPPLDQFLLPQGASAPWHLARAICRRAERRLVAFARADTLAPQVLVYLNRLSDWLFVIARLATRTAGQDDIRA
ncbi:MAG: ATP:cob(I)alamin adenosyltransferase [Vicinamibacteria bacterium]|nr:ATP:cob(I)alamin adenosyltransferase [Vicinamibacteria bacterium]